MLSAKVACFVIVLMSKLIIIFVHEKNLSSIIDYIKNSN